MVVLRHELTVRTDDLLDADIQKLVKRVYVLLDQASETQNGGQKLSLILYLINWLTHLGFVVELIEIVSMDGILLRGMRKPVRQTWANLHYHSY